MEGLNATRRNAAGSCLSWEKSQNAYYIPKYRTYLGTVHKPFVPPLHPRERHPPETRWAPWPNCRASSGLTTLRGVVSVLVLLPCPFPPTPGGLYIASDSVFRRSRRRSPSPGTCASSSEGRSTVCASIIPPGDPSLRCFEATPTLTDEQRSIGLRDVPIVPKLDSIKCTVHTVHSMWARRSTKGDPPSRTHIPGSRGRGFLVGPPASRHGDS